MDFSTTTSRDAATGTDYSGQGASAQAVPVREVPPPSRRTILHVASTPDAPDSPSSSSGADASSHALAPYPEDAPSRPAEVDRDDVRSSKDEPPSRLRGFLVSASKTILTLLLVAVAALAALVIWDYYVVSPWTRDGRVRVQVASIAPQVSGQITELRVADNQNVTKGDTLYIIDPFDFRRALASAQSDLHIKAADLQVKKAEAERRQKLSNLATTAEQQQQYVGSAMQAQAAFDNSQQQVEQAEINLKRTEVKSPVNGFVTNLLMRVGDYAKEGTTNVSVIDADSYWVDGYFEETKMARVCVGDHVEAQLMGYRRPIVGHVSTVTRGISVSDASPSTQGLPNVDPVYTWVRLAQRVPVRVTITYVPPGVPLVSGMTATVTVIDADNREGGSWWSRRWSELKRQFGDVLHRPEPPSGCVPMTDHQTGETSTLRTPEPSKALAPDQVAPGLTPSLTESPKPLR